MNSEVLNNIDPDENYLNTFYQSLDQHIQSDYYSVEKIKMFFDSPRNEFVLLNSNIRSFHANSEYLLTILSSLNLFPSVIIFTETWLNQHNVLLANIEGYSPFHITRATGRGGGVSIYIRNDLTAKKVEEFCICNDTIEILTLEILYDGKIMYIVGIYRPHSGTIENFTNCIGMLLNNTRFSKNKTILAGDFNIDLLNAPSPDVSLFSSTLYSMHFLPTITKPTRFPCTANQRGNPSILDHIWINNLDPYMSCILSTEVSDHCPTFLKLPHKKIECNKVRISFRDKSSRNVQEFERRLCSENLVDYSVQCVSNRTENFVDRLNKIYQQSFPLRSKMISQKRFEKPWLTSGILKSIKTKSEYFRMHKMGLIDDRTYRTYKNILTKVMRKSKNVYFRTIFERNKKNIKENWKIVNKILGKHSDRKKVRNLIVNEIEITDGKLIAEEFVNYFSTVATKLDQQTPPPDLSYTTFFNPSQPNSFFIKPVTVDECVRIISNLKNSKNDVNTVPVYLLKKYRFLLSVSIRNLINESFYSGIFPECLKRATVTPIFKGGSEVDVSCYRPISVVSVFSKIFERAMADRLFNYISKYNIMSSSQFGFLKGKNTSDAISSFIENIYCALDNKNHSLSVFLDLRKAFDTLNHPILFSKLRNYGIRGVAGSWFESFLKDRTLRVKIDNIVSDYKTINIGVPQGTTLAPLLFILMTSKTQLLPFPKYYLRTTLLCTDLTPPISISLISSIQS